MITRADALEVLTLVTACHRRTAPRMDDEQVTMATADTWAELFNAYHLRQADLLAAVKRRALTTADAPEPAEIIAVARDIQRARDAARGPSDDYEARCEAKAEDADELAELRRARELNPPKDRPALHPMIGAVAGRKALPRVEL